MEYLDGCSTIIRCVARKVGLYVLEMILPWGCYFRMGGLTYDSLTLSLSHNTNLPKVLSKFFYNFYNILFVM